MTQNSKGSGALQAPLFQLRRWLLGPGPVLNRLTREIEALNEKCQQLETRGAVGTPDFDLHVRSAHRFLEAASAAADRNSINSGWHAVHGAQQELIQVETSPNLLLLAAELKEECAEKLKGWRGATAKALVSNIEPAPAEPPHDLRERVAEAQRVLDGHSDNVYFKQGYRQMQQLLLKWQLVLSMATIFFVSLSGWPVATASRWYNPEYGIETGSLSSLIETMEASAEAEDDDDRGVEEGEAGGEEEDARTGDEEVDDSGEGERVDDAGEDGAAENGTGNGEVDDNVEANNVDEEAGNDGEGNGEKDEPESGANKKNARERKKANALDLALAVLLFGWLGGSFSALNSVARSTGERKIPQETMDSRVTLLRPLTGAVGAFIVFVTLLAGFPVSGWISSPSVLVFALAAGFSERLAVRGLERVAGSNK